MNRLRSAALVLVLAVAALVSTTSTASASTQNSNWGGVINPNGCSGYTVKSAPIKDWLGRQVGLLEVRWSPTCYVQWARLTAYNGATHLAVSIHESTHWNNAAGADDYNTKQNWTYGIILIDGPSSHVCAYGDIDPGIPGGRGTSFCV